MALPSDFRQSLKPKPPDIMVKFGKRLEEELVKEGWEASYVQYGSLKKLIKAISAHEVGGEMLKAYESQESFLSMLKGSIKSVEDFYVEQAQVLMAEAKAVKEGAQNLDVKGSTKESFSEPANGTAVEGAVEGADEVPRGERLVGVEVMDELARVRDAVQELRMFGLVNREAVRKILKKCVLDHHGSHTVPVALAGCICVASV